MPDVIAPTQATETPPTARLGNAPVAGFGVRFGSMGPDSPFVAWCVDEVVARALADQYLIHRPVILPATVTFE